jgi:hypothetical protein
MSLRFVGDADEPNLLAAINQCRGAVESTRRYDGESIYWQSVELRNNSDSSPLIFRDRLPLITNSGNSAVQISFASDTSLSGIIDTFEYNRICLAVRCASAATSTSVVFGFIWWRNYGSNVFEHFSEVATLDTTSAYSNQIICLPRQARKISLYARRTGSGATNPWISWSIELFPH